MTRILLSLAALGSFAFAEPAIEERKARELLSSPVLLDKAWGVFRASRLAVPDLGTILVEQLASMQPYAGASWDSSEKAYIDVVFDALILSGASVPESVLAPFAERWRDAALIVLARQEGNEELLLSIRGKELGRPQWIAVNNLLPRMRSSRFFRKTLTETALTHTFIVVDESGQKSRGGSGGASAGDGVRRLPKAFPPTGIYQLIDTPREGDVLLLKGPLDVYYRRILIPTDERVGLSSNGPLFEKEKEGLAYIAAWNGAKLEDVRRIFWPTTTVGWSDTAHFQDCVENSLGAQVEAVQDLLDTSRRRGAGDLSGMRLGIAIDVLDDRRGGITLPNIPLRAFAVR